MMKAQDYIDLVQKLNDELPYKGFDDIPYKRFFYTTDGYTHIIGFGDDHLWDDDNDDREWIGEHEKEDLETFLVRQMKRMVEYIPKRFKP